MLFEKTMTKSTVEFNDIEMSLINSRSQWDNPSKGSLVLLGPSSGKTTLLNLIGGFIEPTGKVLIEVKTSLAYLLLSVLLRRYSRIMRFSLI